jgi:hypothetical protein
MHNAVDGPTASQLNQPGLQLSAANAPRHQQLPSCVLDSIVRHANRQLHAAKHNAVDRPTAFQLHKPLAISRCHRACSTPLSGTRISSSTLPCTTLSTGLQLLSCTSPLAISSCNCACSSPSSGTRISSSTLLCTTPLTGLQLFSRTSRAYSSAAAKAPRHQQLPSCVLDSTVRHANRQLHAAKHHAVDRPTAFQLHTPLAVSSCHRTCSTPSSGTRISSSTLLCTTPLKGLQLFSRTSRAYSFQLQTPLAISSCHCARSSGLSCTRIHSAPLLCTTPLTGLQLFQLNQPGLQLFSCKSPSPSAVAIAHARLHCQAPESAALRCYAQRR